MNRPKKKSQSQQQDPKNLVRLAIGKHSFRIKLIEARPARYACQIIGLREDLLGAEEEKKTAGEDDN